MQIKYSQESLRILIVFSDKLSLIVVTVRELIGGLFCSNSPFSPSGMSQTLGPRALVQRSSKVSIHIIKFTALLDRSKYSHIIEEMTSFNQRFQFHR